MSGAAGRPGRAPEEIGGARQAWLATCALQAAGAATTAWVGLADPATVAARVREQGLLGEWFAGIGPAELIAAARSAAVLSLVTTLIFCAFFAFAVSRMARGAAWARTVLIAGSVYLVLQAGLLLLGAEGQLPAPAVPDWLLFLDGGLAIASACAAAAGLVLASTAAARGWFTGDRGRRGAAGGEGERDRPAGGAGPDRGDDGGSPR